MKEFQNWISCCRVQNNLLEALQFPDEPLVFIIVNEASEIRKMGNNPVDGKFRMTLHPYTSKHKVPLIFRSESRTSIWHTRYHDHGIQSKMTLSFLSLKLPYFC